MEQVPIHMTLYAKARCCLCEDAHAVVQEVRRELGSTRPTTLSIVDITTDSVLLTAWRHDVPVLVVDGRPAFRHRVAPERLRARLEHGTPAPLEQ